MGGKKKRVRKREREALMKMIYQMELQGDFSEEEFEKFKKLHIKFDVTEYFTNTYEQIKQNTAKIDALINRHCIKWKVNRLPKVDLSIMRLAVAEMKYTCDVPVPIAINEAVELAKKYGSEKSPKFINGVLGSIVRESESGGKSGRKSQKEIPGGRNEKSR